MTTRMPQEIEVWYIIPAIRREISNIMHEKGIKQTEIAKMLGVTKAAVSQYISSRRASELEFNTEIKDEIRISVQQILDKKSSAFSEIQRICKLIVDTNQICSISKKINKKTPPNCADCIHNKMV